MSLVRNSKVFKNFKFIKKISRIFFIFTNSLCYSLKICYMYTIKEGGYILAIFGPIAMQDTTQWMLQRTLRDVKSNFLKFFYEVLRVFSEPDNCELPYILFLKMGLNFLFSAFVDNFEPIELNFLYDVKNALTKNLSLEFSRIFQKVFRTS